MTLYIARVPRSWLRDLMGDVVLPRGGHLALAIKEKIWRGDYIDIFSLLHMEPDTVLKVGDPLWNQEIVKKRKIIKLTATGPTGFMDTRFIWVVQMFPTKAPTLIKYVDIIHGALRNLGGQAWLVYDVNFP